MPFLDTNVLLDLTGARRGKHQQAAQEAVRRATTDGEALCTSRFNLAELLVGIELCADPVVERRRVDAALEHVTVMEFDEAAAGRFAKIAVRLRQLGKPTGTMDMLIAAVALEVNQAFVTRNPKHFANITGLSIVSY